MQDAAAEDLPGAPPADAAGRALLRLTRALALLGAALLLAMMGLSVWSIAGRRLFDAPVVGDYEWIQLGMAVSVSAFLPLTQMLRGHVIVDFFTLNAPLPVKRGLDALGSLLVAACGALLAWRLGAGALAIRASGEESMLLGIPLWIAYAGMVPSFALLALAGLYTASRGTQRP
jgi:TRAP-type C4-dicarboxylate transport system permease small subunit